MAIQVVEAFSDQPGTCLHCGSGGVGEEVDEPKIEFEGIDINWGDSAYLCGTCVKIICDLAGRVTKKEHEKLKKTLEETREDLELKEAENEELKTKVDRILAGSKAKKELREAVNG